MLKRIVDYFHGKEGEWTAFATVVLAVFTAVLMVFTALLYFIAVKADDTAVSGQRAFVNFAPNGEVGTYAPNGKVVSWSVNIPVTNSGNTPTRNLSERVNVYFTRDELPSDFNFPDTGRPDQEVLAPKQTLSYEADPVPIEEIKAVHEAHGHVYVYGWASYKDQFPGTPLHRTEFCYQLRLNSMPGDVTDPKYNLQGRLMSCHRHNCADEECQEKAN